MSKTKDEAIPLFRSDDPGTPVVGSVESGDPIVAGLAWTNGETWSHPVDTSNMPFLTGGGPDATEPIGNQAIPPRRTR